MVRGDDRYVILGEHGRGGLGRVLRAHDRHLGRVVAIKELLDPSPRSELRFFREALVTARLEHPGIVAVHDMGRWPNGKPFYAMKLVSGHALSDILSNSQEVQLANLIPRLAAVADAVAYAHDKGVVHRDLKPSNIIVGDYGETIVIDWGLAKFLEADEPLAATTDKATTNAPPAITLAGTVLGTPAYMPPEQARGTDVDARADVYSLGVILRELMERGTSETRRDEDLQAIVIRATANDRAERYANGREFARDLHRYLAGRPVSARRYSIRERLARWLHLHRAVAASLSAAAFVVVMIAIVAAFRIVRARNAAVRARRSAEAALVLAEQRRAAAITSAATALLPRDPTAAWRILDDAAALPDNEVLAARIKSAGVADREVSVGDAPIVWVGPLDGGPLYAVVTIDGRLHLVDARTGTHRALADKLAIPPKLSLSDGEIAYVQRDTTNLHIVVSDTSSSNLQTLDLPTAPVDIRLAPAAVYILAPNGDLVRIDRTTGRADEIAQNLESFALFAGKVVACTRQRKLISIGSEGERLFGGGECGPTPFFEAKPGLLVVPGRADILEVHSDEGFRRVAFDATVPPPRYEIGYSGIVGGVSASGRGLVLSPQGPFEEIPLLGSRPDTLFAEGSLVGWGFNDGTLIVLDTRNRHSRVIKADSSPIKFVYAERATGRILTASSHRLRVWEFGGHTAERVATLPSTVLSIADSRNGAVLALNNGDVFLLDDERALRHLHSHVGPAIAAAWCGNAACTASWDGRVLCTNTAGNSSTALVSDSPLRWLVDVGDDCAYATRDGVVGTLRRGQIGAGLVDPIRVRVGAVGELLVGDADGRLRVFAPSEPVSTIASRGTPMMDVAWLGDLAIGVSLDGTVVAATRTGSVVWSATVDGLPVRLVVAAARPVVITDSGDIYCFGSAGDLLKTVALDAEPTTTAVSPDGGIVVVGTSTGEMFILDAASLEVDVIKLAAHSLKAAVFIANRRVLTSTSFGDVYVTNLE